jgi:trans-2-enoyl-CoA reductase
MNGEENTQLSEEQMLALLKEKIISTPAQNVEERIALREKYYQLEKNIKKQLSIKWK